MFISDPRKRLKNLMLLNLRADLKSRETAEEVHHHLRDIHQLQDELYDRQQEVASHESDIALHTAFIDELLKEQSELDVEIIRLNRKEARLKRKNNKPADHANQEHKSFDLSSDDQKLHFVKCAKNALLRRITKVVFDDRASDKMTVGFGTNAQSVGDFEIAHEGKEADQIEHEIWQQVGANSTHLADWERLFSQGKMVG